MKKIGIIGLGYVGLPLAVAFGEKYLTYGYDVNFSRINEIEKFHDSTKEVSKKELKSSRFLHVTSNLGDLSDCNIYIITVPTPINNKKKPDFSFLIDASKKVGSIINDKDIIIYESTVYPGATEEICVPHLQRKSGLTYINQNNEKKVKNGFYCGYSPERINPGDKKHRLKDIKKIVSGSTNKTANKIKALYESIIKAGVHKVPNIKTAEAAKVIENTQRDLNIAFVNELSIIFNKLDIDTEEVLKAAETKWNFHSFRPGLVGGHCIGVDPYYLTEKAKRLNYNPKVILSGRNLNDNMINYVVDRIIYLARKKRINLKKSKVLVMGLTFKENCPDIRNSLSFRLVDKLSTITMTTHTYDPWIDKSILRKKYRKNHRSIISEKNYYNVIILAVAHNEFKSLGHKKIKNFATTKSIIYDLKYILDPRDVDGRM